MICIKIIESTLINLIQDYLKISNVTNNVDILIKSVIRVIIQYQSSEGLLYDIQSVLFL